MNSGLPGTGIGGLFYLVTALIMPVFEVIQTVRGRSNPARWRFVFSTASMAIAIVAGMWAISWIIGMVLSTFSGGDLVQANLGVASKYAVRSNIARFANMVLALGILAGTLISVEVLGAVVHKK